MNSTGTPQSMLYQIRGQQTAPSDGNGVRNRKVEQQHSYNSGNPMNYTQFLNGQDPSLGRYTPPTLSTQSPTSPQWNNNQGGYAYNLPTSFGGFGGWSQFSQQPQGGMQQGQMQNIFQQIMGQQGGGASYTKPPVMAKPAQAMNRGPGSMPPVQGERQRPTWATQNGSNGTYGYNTMPSQGMMSDNAAEYGPTPEQIMKLLQAGQRQRSGMGTITDPVVTV